MVNPVCESQLFIVCLKVKAIGQEGQPNLLDTDWHPQPGGHNRSWVLPIFNQVSSCTLCIFDFVIASSSHLCGYCDHYAYFCEILQWFSDFFVLKLFCNLVGSWKVLWKVFWSPFLLTWCIWLCPCACLCCSWCVVFVHSCISLWLSVQCSFLSPFPSVAEGHQMTDFRVYNQRKHKSFRHKRHTQPNIFCKRLCRNCDYAQLLDCGTYFTAERVA